MLSSALSVGRGKTFNMDLKKKYDVGVWTGFISPRTMFIGGLLWLQYNFRVP